MTTEEYIQYTKNTRNENFKQSDLKLSDRDVAQMCNSLVGEQGPYIIEVG